MGFDQPGVRQELPSRMEDNGRKCVQDEVEECCKPRVGLVPAGHALLAIGGGTVHRCLGRIWNLALVQFGCRIDAFAGIDTRAVFASSLGVCADRLREAAGTIRAGLCQGTLRRHGSSESKSVPNT